MIREEKKKILHIFIFNNFSLKYEYFNRLQRFLDAISIWCQDFFKKRAFKFGDSVRYTGNGYRVNHKEEVSYFLNLPAAFFYVLNFRMLF